MREIITPAVVVDYDILLANIEKMSSYGRKNHIGIRPHFKTHKCVEVAKLQMKHGATGITVQTIDEAEALVKNGVGKVLLANELVDEGKINRFLSLIKKSNEVILAVENEINLYLLDRLAGFAGKKLNVLVEVDVGMNRCGQAPGIDTLTFVQKAMLCRNIVFKGLQGYEGHTVFIPERKERTEAAGKALSFLVDTKKLLQSNGIDCSIVSAGGTGTYDLAGRNWNITDIQPGSYVFMDAKYSSVICDFRNAIYVLATVICRRSNGDYIADAGYKAFTSEFGLPVLKDLKGELVRLNEEHCRFKIRKGKKIKNKVIKIIPSHCCTTVNLYDNIYVVRKNKVVDVWKINRSRKT